MTPVRLILDCDPGLDDALALLLAHADPRLELVAVTTVGGNVGLAATTRNALRLREYLGFDSVPVAAGAEEPLVRVAENAAHVHGDSGLGDLVLPDARLDVDPAHAVELIVETLAASPGEVHLVATGPLTNIALALEREPRIAEWAASFVMMGGSSTRGNATPAAEFNAFADPDAAARVFAAGWDVVMIGLDLTLQAIVTDEVVQRMRRLGRLGNEFVVPLSTFWVDQSDDAWNGQALHDVCAVAYLAHPEVFRTRRARVEVETSGRFTSGMTVVDFSADGSSSGAPNAVVAVELRVDEFWNYVLDAWRRVDLDLAEPRHPSA